MQVLLQIERPGLEELLAIQKWDAEAKRRARCGEAYQKSVSVESFVSAGLEETPIADDSIF